MTDDEQNIFNNVVRIINDGVTISGLEINSTRPIGRAILAADAELTALRARIECMEKERNLMIEGAHESAIKRERLKEAARGFVKDCHYCGGTRTVAIRTSESRLVKGRVEPMPDMEREEPCEYCGPTRAALDALKEGK